MVEQFHFSESFFIMKLFNFAPLIISSISSNSFHLPKDRSPAYCKKLMSSVSITGAWSKAGD